LRYKAVDASLIYNNNGAKSLLNIVVFDASVNESYPSTTRGIKKRKGMLFRKPLCIQQ
jgi:hypothetical protein